MSIRDHIATLRTAAIAAGIKLPHHKLSDALSLCVFGHTYSWSVAAERAGKPPIAAPTSERIERVASNYRLAAGMLKKVVMPAGTDFTDLRVKAADWDPDQPRVAYAEVELNGRFYTLQFTRPPHPNEMLRELDEGVTIALNQGHDDNADFYEAFNDAGADWDSVVEFIVRATRAEKAIEASERHLKLQERGSLWIYDSGASTAEIDVGIDAALEVLRARGFSVKSAALASLAAADDRPYDVSAEAAWRDAEIAAINACCEGWARIPESATLVAEGITLPDEDEPA